MIKYFLRLRILQIRRELLQLGWWRAGILLVICFFGGVALYQQLRLFPRCLYVTGLLAIAVGMIHLSRKDKTFVLMTGESPARIFFAEYAVFSVPVFILMLLTPFWYLPLALLATYAGLSVLYYRPYQKTGFTRSFSFLPPDNFEWESGIRINFWVLLLLYLAAIGFSVYAYVSLYILWLLVAVIASFYQECEPLQILGTWEMPPREFVHRKVRSHLKCYLVFCAPIILAYVICHPRTSWLAVLVVVLSCVNLSFFILSKYAIYEPQRKLTANATLVSVIHLFMLVPMAGPFLFPVPLVMGIRAYRKSLHQLKYYLNAYN